MVGYGVVWGGVGWAGMWIPNLSHPLPRPGKVHTFPPLMLYLSRVNTTWKKKADIHQEIKIHHVINSYIAFSGFGGIPNITD